MTSEITEQELTEARKIWGDALVAVSEAFDESGIEAATEIANQAIDAAYGWFTVSQLWLAGVLAYLFGRVLGMRRTGATVMGLIYQGCGFTADS